MSQHDELEALYPRTGSYSCRCGKAQGTQAEIHTGQEKVCLRCKEPTRDTASFYCAQCRQDFRDAEVRSAENLKTFREHILEPGGGGVRTFATGANRDTDEGKLDYEGFYSPLVLERFAAYMDRHRSLRDGTIRDSDNFQRGIPLEAYMKSLLRHVLAAWKRYRGWDDTDMQEHLCGVLFNTMGMLHELLKRVAGGVSGEVRGPHAL